MIPKHLMFLWVYLLAFILGFVLMGFEMLGSRYLYPYFGGGIGTWASLISMVLVAIACGSFLGGHLADRYNSLRVCAAVAMAVAAYLALIPTLADPILHGIEQAWGDEVLATILGASVLSIVPVALLSTYSPVAVRLLISATESTGRIAGSVYAVSTMGNVVGTLFTTFVLIPQMGSKKITYVFAGVLVLVSLATLAFSVGRRDAARS